MIHLSQRGRLGVMAAVAVLSATTGWAGATTMRSPGDARFDAKAPAPSAVLVPLETRELATRIVTRGEGVVSDAAELRVDPRMTDGAPAIVTGKVATGGQTLAEGDVALEVNGRPVLLLAGRVPAFRTMLVGSDGIDVKQLEEALSRLALDPGKVDGVFDAATRAAMVSLYARSGYSPRRLSAEDQQRLDAARERVATAKRARDEARRSATKEAETLAAGRAQAEAEATAAERALEVARASSAASLAEADASIARAARERDIAASGDRRAAARLGQARNGTHPDTGNPPSEEEMRTLEDEAAQASALHGDAIGAYDVAVAQRRVTEVSGDAQVRDANDALALARDAAARAAAASGDGSSLLDEATSALADAQRALDEVAREQGVAAPVGEVLFLPGLPRTVSEVEIGLGDVADDVVYRVAGSDVRVRGEVSEEDGSLLEIGARVEVSTDRGDVELEGRIAGVGDTGTQGSAADRRPVDVVITTGDVAKIRGVNVRLSIPVASTDGAVLAAPLSSVFTGTDGATYLRVERGVTIVRVKVSVGLVADGWVAVRADGGNLREGELVVVGRTQRR